MAPREGQRLALVVAVSSFQDPALRRLRAPAGDAAALADLLDDPDIGGFTVTTVLDGTAQRIRLAIEEFLADRSPADLVLVYLSSHGLVDLRRRLYFAAQDTLKTRLAASGVESHWLLDQLEDCRARRQVVILDCCFSGAFAEGAKGESDLDLGSRLLGQGRGRVVLTASRGTEYSFEGAPVADAEEPGSVFTEALVTGIRTGAADGDRDGYISVDDAYTYAFDRVRQAGAQQTPQRWLYGAEGDIVLARSPVSATSPLSTRPPEREPVPASSAAPLETTHDAGPAGRPRWVYGLVALVVVAAVGGIAWALWPGGRDPAGSGVDASPQPSGSVSTGPDQTIIASAPWRISVDSRDVIGDGCEVTLTNSDTRATTRLPVVWGNASYQMHESGTFRWSAGDAACVVLPQPTAGITRLPLAVPLAQGDTPAFETDGPVQVEVKDFQGSATCDVGLRTVSDGRLVAEQTVEESNPTVELDPLGESPVYLSGHTCGVHLSHAE